MHMPETGLDAALHRGRRPFSAFRPRAERSTAPVAGLRPRCFVRGPASAPTTTQNSGSLGTPSVRPEKKSYSEPRAAAAFRSGVLADQRLSRLHRRQLVGGTRGADKHEAGLKLRTSLAGTSGSKPLFLHESVTMGELARLSARVVACRAGAAEAISAPPACAAAVALGNALLGCLGLALCDGAARLNHNRKGTAWLRTS
jgi:hypothetical protein